jgi:hypothetical protein
MSADYGHITNCSIGRGVRQQLKDGGTRLIKPGDPIKTGCKVLLPTNIFNDYIYDITQHAIIVESWKGEQSPLQLSSFRISHPFARAGCPGLDRQHPLVRWDR